MARTPSLGDTIIRATAPPGEEESAHDRPRASAMSKQPCARRLLRALRRLCCYADEVTLFSRRLPHVLTRSDLVLLLAPTYAKARLVADDEASERVAHVGRRARRSGLGGRRRTPRAGEARGGDPGDLGGAHPARSRDRDGTRVDAGDARDAARARTPRRGAPRARRARGEGAPARVTTRAGRAREVARGRSRRQIPRREVLHVRCRLPFRG